ncbi:very long chain fatty acid elongase F-like [Brevipalpus obovatus]|uniref:very long chain fatty acid elongase F-like n=1 Tax=Brevipalpus obovatus TaxID=246614 RepID=UPI003D9E9070
MSIDDLDKQSSLRLLISENDGQETTKKLVLLFLVYYYFVKVIGPKWMRFRPPFDLYPHMLIYNGYQFGVHGVGFILALWTTSFGTASWTCVPVDLITKDIKSLFAVYVAHIFFWAKILECLETVMYILMKKRRYVHLIEIFRTFANVGLIYTGLKKYPGNVVVFYPLIDLLVGVFIFGHNTLLSASVDLKTRRWWKKFIFTLRLMEFGALFIHGLYILIQSSCCVPRLLPIYECVFALFNIVIICCYYFNITYRVNQVNSQYWS